MNRKEYIYAELDKLSDKRRWKELTEQEQVLFDGYNDELAIMELQEQGLLKDDDMKKKRARKKVDKRWKSAEDWVCERLGLKREGHMKRGVSCADGINNMFSVDVTSTKRKLVFVNGELDDAKAHATQGRTPVVVIFQVGKRREEGIVCLRFWNFEEICGK